MTKEAFEPIQTGLLEALEFAKADRYREATEAYAAALKADYHISLDAAHEVIAAALAAAEQRGRDEERERCAKVADEKGVEYERLASQAYNQRLHDQHYMRAEACQGLAAAIRQEPTNHG